MRNRIHVTLDKREETPVQTVQDKHTETTNRQPKSYNGLGIAGFIIAVICFFIPWIPGNGWLIWLIIGWFIWLIGLILSYYATFKKPKALAIAGLILSIIDFAILILFTAGLATLIIYL